MFSVTCKKLKIFNRIVQRIFVAMMNDFSTRQKSAKIFFHHKPMLCHITGFGCIWMMGGKYVAIFPHHRLASIPGRIILAGLSLTLSPHSQAAGANHVPYSTTI